MLTDGEVVTHMVERGVECQLREHGVVRSGVPEDSTYDGSSHPEWVGVAWSGGKKTRHPRANLFTCTCPGDAAVQL